MSSHHIRLTDGRAFELDVNAHRIGGGGGALDKGDLVLVGRDNDGQWYESLAGASRDCWALETNGVDAADSIVFPNLKLRLMKAPSFDPAGGVGGVYQSPMTPFCIDSQGRVVKYGIDL